MEIIEELRLIYYGRPQTKYDRLPKILLTRVFDIVSLDLFYNFGRLPLKFAYGCNGRVMWTALQHDRTWIKSRLGYHCQVCGEVLEGRFKLFCSQKCENFFNANFVQTRTWNFFRWLVLDRDNGKCVWCGKTLSTKDENGCWNLADFVCDHVVPLFKGGRDWWEDSLMENFQTLCVNCNKQKTARDLRGSKPVESLREVDVSEVFWYKENFGALDSFLFGEGDC